MVTLLVWLPMTMRNDFVDWDDLLMIVSNPRFNPPTLEGIGWYWTHVAWNLYQPLTCTLWGILANVSWVETADQFGGHANPAVFHLASVLLHLAATLALFSILRRAVRNDLAAAIGACLFAIHPLQVEAVAFAGAMNNPLFAALGLLAIQQYLGWIETQERARWIAGTLALILALLAKPTAVVIPPIALVLDWGIHRRDAKVMLRSIAPWFLLIVPCVIWTKIAQHGSVAGAQAPIWFRPFIFGDVAAFYLLKLIVPMRLAIDYGRNPAALYANPMTYIVWLVPAALAVGGFMLRRRQPVLAAGVAIFLIALLPNSGLVAFDYEAISAAADRYAYLALAGVALVVASLCSRVRSIHLGIGASVFVVVLGVLTMQQIKVWQNGETLFRHALAINPRSWTSWSNYANVIADRSPDEAIDACRKAIAIKPDYASAYNNLGSLLMSRGDRTAAIEAFAAAHQYDPVDPTFAANHARAQAESATTRP